jgi:hypothetical protein
MKKLIVSIILIIIVVFANPIQAQDAAYLTTSGEPWGQTSNISAFNTTYGAEGTGWKKFIYSSATVNEVFTSNRKMVLIEGGESNTSIMINFLNSDWPSIESWISNGGLLIVNAATNQSLGKFEIGSSGIFSERILTTTMQANVDASAYPEPPHVHPLFTIPDYPAFYAGDYSGSYIAHNIITGNYSRSIFTSSNGNTLVEKTIGSGSLLVGGLTLPFFITHASWQPQPQMSNLLYSTLEWAHTETQGYECRPLTIYLRSNGTYTLSMDNMLTLINGSPGDQVDISVSPNVFTCEQAGKIVPVTVSVTNAQGNVFTCETTIWVIDGVAPQVLCKDTILYLDGDGKAELTAPDLDAGTSDACGIKSTWLDIYKFDCSNIGENSVTLFAKDIHNNWSSCVSTVTVADNTVPVVHAVADIEIEVAHGIKETLIAYPEIAADDNCEIEFELVEGIGPEGTFPIGTTTETWQISDAAGNETTISFTVTITEFNTAPYVLQPFINSLLAPSQFLKLPLIWKDLFNDADDDELDYEVIFDNEDTITWSVLSNDTLSFFPATGDTGCVNITLRATDPLGAFIENKFNVCIVKNTVNANTINYSDINAEIYPNPANDKFNISLQPSGYYNVELKMTDMTGRLIVHRKYKPGEHVVVDVSDKIAGMYLIQLNVDNHRLFKKITVQ